MNQHMYPRKTFTYCRSRTTESYNFYCEPYKEGEVIFLFRTIRESTKINYAMHNNITVNAQWNGLFDFVFTVM